MIDPQQLGTMHAQEQEEAEALSRIIAELNERFGLNLGPEHGSPSARSWSGSTRYGLDASARVNTPRTCGSRSIRRSNM